jgi:tetratricopeptide (TPR) repeat protein
MRYCYLILVLCWSNFVTAQQTIDSLKLQLKQHPNADTIRASILNKLGMAYAEEYTDEGLVFADSSIALSKRLGSLEKLASAYFVKGYTFMLLENYRPAIHYFKQAFALSNYLGRTKTSLVMAQNIGMCYGHLSNYKKAIASYETALNLADKLPYSSYEGTIRNSLGVVYLNLSDYTLALSNFQKALLKAEEAKNEGLMRNTYTNLGLLYSELKNHDKAISYHNKSLKSALKDSDKYAEAHSYNNLGNAFDDLGDSNKSIEMYTKALQINEELSYKFGIASNLINIGIIQNERGEFAQAYNNFKKAETLFRQLDDLQNLALVLNSLGNTYSKASIAQLTTLEGERINFRKKAIEIKKEALELSRQIGSLEREAEILKQLAELSTNLGNFKDATSYYAQLSVLKDSVFSDEKKAEIIRLETHYEYEKKAIYEKAENEKQQAISQEEIKIQRIKNNVILGGGSFMAISAFIGFLSYKRRNDSERRRMETDFKLQVSDTEMKALRAQMNPHFIFNSLNSISEYVAKNDSLSADLYLSKFAKLMRTILENSDKRDISLSEDLSALELYIQLESLRFKDGFDYEIKVDSHIDQENTFLPPLLLQPFVENSIWHGLSEKQGKGKISIQIVTDGNMIRCIVEDNGVGRKQAKLQEKTNSSKSMGMKITQSRIDILNKLQNTNSKVNLIDLSEGLRVELSLPYIAA